MIVDLLIAFSNHEQLCVAGQRSGAVMQDWKVSSCIRGCNALMQHELPRAICTTANSAIHVVVEEVKPCSKGLRLDFHAGVH